MIVAAKTSGLALALAAAAFSCAIPATAQRALTDSDPAAAPSEASPSEASAAAQQLSTPAAIDRPVADEWSVAVGDIIRWVTVSADNKGLPFIVIDKVGAEVFVFDSQGQLLGHTAALLGITPGDDSVPGVGERELRKIPVADRTTPAGRFMARFGPAAGGHRSVLWVDYGTAISLHAVISSNPKEHRLQRIKSPTPQDNRITFGCINVPMQFYAKVVNPLFKQKTGGVVYILPDTKRLDEVFPTMHI